MGAKIERAIGMLGRLAAGLVSPRSVKRRRLASASGQLANENSATGRRISPEKPVSQSESVPPVYSGSSGADFGVNPFL